jgi:hypothetical protein
MFGRNESILEKTCCGMALSTSLNAANECRKRYIGIGEYFILLMHSQKAILWQRLLVFVCKHCSNNQRSVPDFVVALASLMICVLSRNFVRYEQIDKIIIRCSWKQLVLRADRLVIIRSLRDVVFVTCFVFCYQIGA